MDHLRFSKTIFALLLLAGLGLASLTANAQTAAQNAYRNYVSPYDEHGAPYGSRYYTQRPDKVYLSLSRREGLPEDAVVLRIGLTVTMSGCPKMSELEKTVQFGHEEIEIEVSDYTVDMRNMPKNPQYECAGAQTTPAAEVVLTKQDLIANNVKRIRLRVGKVSDFYDVTVNDHMILMLPSALSLGKTQYYMPLKIGHVENPLKRWFYPENTLILYVPDAAPGTNIRAQIDEFAQKQGLTPLEQIYYDFKSPIVDPNHFYYVDRAGKIARRITVDAAKPIGAITTEKTVYGLVNDETISTNMQVYAKKPGAYE